MLMLSVTVAFVLLGALWLAAVLHERGLRPMRKMAALMKRPAAEIALVAMVAVGMIHHGATKGTNGVNQLPPQSPRGAAPALPTAITQPATNADWLAFGGYADWSYLGDGGWCFRFGSNLVERLTVFACGEISSAPYDASNRISVLGLPLSIAPAANWNMIGNPQRSLFWHAETPSNTLVLTWENALVDRDTNLPVTVQAELFPDGAAALRYDFAGIGDIGALSNAVSRIWRDGVEAAVPLQTGAVAEVAFSAPPVTDTNALDEVYALIAGGDSNAYYFVDVAVSKGPARITVEADGESTLGSYGIMAEPGVTNRLPLLIGPRYAVSSEAAFASFAVAPSERQTDESYPAATNLTDRLVEVQWPVAFALDEVSSTTEETVYALRVTPDFLNGTVVWSGASTNEPMRGAPPTRSGGGCVCGCLSLLEGFTNMIAHATTCQCSDCSVQGEYVYAGYTAGFELSLGGGGEEDPPGPDDPGGDPPEPTPPSVSVSFEKPVVIFEDTYENPPGVTVPRSSTTTKLTLTASGGDYGGTISLSVVGGLAICAGQSAAPGYVAPNQSISWEADYEGVSASPSQGGAIATASIMDSMSLQTSESSASMTVIEIKVKALVTAPQNPCWQRHDYGVCEQVVLQHFPSSANVVWSVTGSGTMQSGTYDTFICPPTGGTPSLTASSQGTDYSLDLNIIEPQGIVASNVTAIANLLPTGIAGRVGMSMEQYVTPFTVSFSRIAIEEVPCEEGFHSGYYSDPSMSNLWSHTYSNGAGLWHAVNMANRITIDHATCGACPQPWSQGTLIWNVPFGWHPLIENGNAPAIGTLPTKEFATDVRSTITINSTGFVILMKLGHWVSRDIYNEVTLDGVVIMEGGQ